MNNALHTAINELGSQAALGRAIGYTPQAVSRMVREGRVSAEAAIKISRVTSVSREALRPDLFGQIDGVAA